MKIPSTPSHLTPSPFPQPSPQPKASPSSPIHAIAFFTSAMQGFSPQEAYKGEENVTPSLSAFRNSSQLIQQALKNQTLTDGDQEKVFEIGEKVQTQMQAFLKALPKNSSQKKQVISDLKLLGTVNKACKTACKRKSPPKNSPKKRPPALSPSSAPPLHEKRVQHLPLSEVAQARYSHASISKETAHTQGTNTTLSIHQLSEAIFKKGWDSKAPPLELIRMPDGKLTCWNNRRLWALKDIHQNHPKKEMLIPVTLASSQDPVKPKNLLNLTKKLSPQNLAIETSADAQIQELQTHLKQTAAKLKKEGEKATEAERVLARVSMDLPIVAGSDRNRTEYFRNKPVLYKTTPVKLRQRFFPAMMGYDSVRVR